MPEPATAAARVQQAYARVRERLAAAAKVSGRPADAVGLVAVTKSATPGQILALLAAGHRDLAENRIQALMGRMHDLEAEPTAPRDVRWHMIGHPQRNKVEQVLGRVVLIHSVDSLRLAEAISRVADKRGVAAVDVLIEVNISREISKYGVAPMDVEGLAERITAMRNLRLRGLMTMAPYSERSEDARPVFRQCRELKDELRRRYGEGVDTLSMGMSGDFEVAAQEGATLVRVGRALFE